jgi:hypothetical protein
MYNDLGSRREDLDEYFTQNLSKLDPSKGGVTTRSGFRMVALDRIFEDYLKITRRACTGRLLSVQ